MNYPPLGLLKELVIKKLESELPPGVYYHAPRHTLDVFSHALSIAEKENFTVAQINLVGAAALFHDTGYIFSHSEHELHSCNIAQSILALNGYSEFDIAQICELIMATKIPQTPNSKLAMVLCDADLDYLGRDDFFTLSEELYREMIFFGSVKSDRDWQQLQINFLEKHHYFTETEIKLRNERKLEHLTFLKCNYC